MPETFGNLSMHRKIFIIFFFACAWIAAGPNAPWTPQTASVLLFEREELPFYESLLFSGKKLLLYESPAGVQNPDITENHKPAAAPSTKISKHSREIAHQLEPAR